MKLAVFSESPADETAIRIIVDAILGIQTEPVALPSLRTRGWPSVRDELPVVLKHLCHQADAEAFILVVDSDNSPIHQQAHKQSDTGDEECRVCLLSDAIDQTLKWIKPKPNRMPIKIAVGLAVPAIEAWYRCGVDPHSTEAMPRQRLGAGARELKKQLKRDVYGTDRPSLALETKRAIEEATRLAQNLDLLEQWFPDGFGALARAVRGW